MTNPIQTQYEDLMRYVRANGVDKTDRTGTGTRSIFGYQMRYDLSKGFPLVTTKKVHLKSIILELLWFLRGDTNVKWLQENGCTIWDEWAREDGSLGPVYGKQWRAWSTGRHIPTPDKDGHVWHLEEKIDQIAQLIEQIKTNPDSRRMMVNAWNVGDLPSMALHPCHYGFQAYVANGKLSLHVQQRSCDVLLGLPFNVASYALLTHMLAQQCDLGVGDLVWSGGDVHLYRNHEEQVTLQLSRDPFPFPTLNIKRKPDSIDGYTLDDFEIVGYQHHPAIKAPVAV